MPPLDYGQRHKPYGLKGFGWVGLLAGGLLVVVLVWNWRGHRAQEQAEGWTGQAPACPTLDAQAYRARYAARERPTTYDDVILARQFGHVMCKDVDTAGGFGFMTHPVCQFTSPTAIRVRANGRDSYFEPGSGRLATVSVERAGVRCRLTGKFTLFKDPTQLGSVGS